MNVFACQEGEAIVLNGEIIVYVVEITDDEVCLEIITPDGVAVRPGEGVGQFEESVVAPRTRDWQSY